MFIPRPTGAGWLFLTAAAVALGTAFMNVGLITALIASIMTAFAISGFLMAFFAAAGFDVRRETMLEGCCQDKISLPLTVRNGTALYRQPCVITETLAFVPQGHADWGLPALRPRETIRLKREITAVRRGHFHLEKLQIIAGDPCGLFRVRKTFRLPGEMVILPKVRKLDELPAGNGGKHSFSGDGRPLGRSGTGSDFFGVRPYRPGDEIRYVHWRLSASKQKLMVREFEAATIERIILILDTGADLVGLDPTENNFETLVSLAASICEFFASQYCYLTFFTCFNGSLMQINGDAAGVRLKILELLTELQPTKNKVENLLMKILENIPQDAMLYLLTMSESEDLKGMLHLLENQNVQLHWICADKKYFPVISEDEPLEMVLPPAEQRFPQVFGPRLLTYQTDWKELFQDENAET